MRRSSRFAARIDVAFPPTTAGSFELVDLGVVAYVCDRPGTSLVGDSESDFACVGSDGWQRKPTIVVLTGTLVVTVLSGDVGGTLVYRIDGEALERTWNPRMRVSLHGDVRWVEGIATTTPRIHECL